MYVRTFQYDPLRGFELRYVLLDHLLAMGRPLITGELVAHVDRCGFRLPAGRPGKRVSDAIRREIAVGRVRRVDRGRYVAVASIPPSTRAWVRRRAAAARAAAGQTFLTSGMS